MGSTERIDIAMAALQAKFGGRSESEEVSRHTRPDRSTIHTRDAERSPDWYQRERSIGEDRATASWSGGSFRGDNWSGGRSR